MRSFNAMGSKNGRLTQPLPNPPQDFDVEFEGTPGTGAPGDDRPSDEALGGEIVPSVAGGANGDVDANIDQPSRAYDIVVASMRGMRTPFGLGDDPARKKYKELLEFLTDRQFP